MSDATPDVMDYTQAAAWLTISRPTLERMVRADRIPHVRLGGRVLFRRAALLDWLAAQERGGAAHVE